MTPKEMAMQLFDKFNDEIPANDSANVYEFMERDFIASKNCALIAVDEIIKSNPHSPSEPLEIMPHFFACKYWQEVKQEIEKL